MSGDAPMAIDEFTQALKLDPKFVQAYLNRGRAYEMLGHYDKAMAEFDRASAIDPSVKRQGVQMRRQR